MAKKQPKQTESAVVSGGYLGGLSAHSDWQGTTAAIAQRFNQEYRGEPFDLPAEVEAMPIFRERVSGQLQAKLTSPFWQLAKPQKQQHCLDIGCGISFLIYPWREWEAVFHGLEISTVARDILNARGPQLNSKLFKGVQLGAAHQLNYEGKLFDLVIATGVSCYYPLDYWKAVLEQVKSVLKPGGSFVFDVVDEQSSIAENWAILETYLGTEVFLEPLSEWKGCVQSVGGKVAKTLPGEVFQLMKVQFG